MIIFIYVSIIKEILNKLFLLSISTCIKLKHNALIYLCYHFCGLYLCKDYIVLLVLKWVHPQTYKIFRILFFGETFSFLIKIKM